MGVYNKSPMDKKVSAARRAATNMKTGNAARETVDRNAKTAGVKLSVAEKRAAQKVLQARIKIDRGKTAARGAAIQKVQEKKAAAKRMAAATGNSQSKVTPKAKPATASKATAKPTTKATAKPTVKATPKSVVKPAPTPTSLSQLKNTFGTMMNYPEGKQGTKEDRNTYSGTYGGKNWMWKNGKATSE